MASCGIDAEGHRRRQGFDLELAQASHTDGDWLACIAGMRNLCTDVGGVSGRRIWDEWSRKIRQRLVDGVGADGAGGQGAYDALARIVLQSVAGCCCAERGVKRGDSCGGSQCIAVGCGDEGSNRRRGESACSTGFFGLHGVGDRSSIWERKLRGSSEDGYLSAVNVASSQAVAREDASREKFSSSFGSAVGSTVGVRCGGDVECVSARTLVNREKRIKKKNRKLRKQAGVGSFPAQADDVPEWRRGSNPFGALVGDKYRGAFSSCSEDVRRQLAETRAKRLIAENEACVRRAVAEADGWEHAQKLKKDQRRLKVLQVGQQIELTRSRDLEKIKKRDEVRVLRDTETGKVEVERAFGTLALTGNVPSLAGGCVETVLSSGSISPNSSISEAEVRKLQKDFADLEAEQLKVRKSNDALVNRLRRMQTCVDNGDFVSAKKISSEDCQAMYEESAGVSLDEDGVPYGILDDGCAGYIDSRGRFHFGDDGNACVDYY